MHDDFTYDTWTMILEQAYVTLGGSEAHGIVIGLLCAGVADDDMVIAALGADENDTGLRDSLEAARRRITEGSAEVGLSFEPLLPDDERPAVQRSRALSEWCRGFVTGFYFLDRGTTPHERSEIVTEALADINDLAEASGTVGESDLSELVEYLRVAVQLIHDEVVE
ncbi:UPF0149 family protein [Acidiferrobacter sp.]|jgi:uncharacterized protein YgfB (UPF0149 family)|uniref:UPF0149 family protein n=1 Tax=Acidiferrobacter sp. TaxID=1872107 RepID=UPI00262BC54A|nr:UPF0149 family protein [Acidiferrobacter sp.]